MNMKNILLVLFLIELCQSAKGSSTTPDPFKKDVKIEAPSKKNETQKKIIQVDDSSTPLSTAAESVITFVSVFVVGCVITISVYSWKKFKPSSSWRMPVSYQYSALGQFDNDPDEDVIDPENSLNMMVEDSTSDDDEIVAETKSSKTIGAIDLDNPPDADAPATLPVSLSENISAPKKIGRQRSGSNNLMDDSDAGSKSRHSSLNDDVFANSNGGSASISITTNGVSNDQDLMSR